MLDDRFEVKGTPARSRADRAHVRRVQLRKTRLRPDGASCCTLVRMTHMQPTWTNDMLAALASTKMDEVDLERALKLKDEHIPAKLFRFRSISGAREWDNLRNGKAWMSAANVYNDPFDSGTTVDWQSLRVPSWKDRIRTADFPWLTDPVRQQLLENPDPIFEYSCLVASGGKTPTENERERIRDLIEEYTRNISAIENPSPAIQAILHACSLTENSSSLSMWSHYADEHKGICIEYDFGALPKGDINRNRLYPVCYNSKRFDSSKYFVEMFSGANPVNLFFPLLACMHKSPEFSYEKEWRLVEFNLGNSGGAVASEPARGAETDMPAASHIYLGARIKPENEAMAVALCAELSVPVSKMRLSDTEYKVEPHRLPG